MEQATPPGYGAVLEALAGEIELAGARCILLDSLIGGVMPDLPPAASEKLQASLQAIDLLSQHLAGLSAFARRLGMETEDLCEAPVALALQDVSLGALADRLLTALGGESQGVEERDQAGDLDLF
ncbi:hypothetical protein [Phenylobacterium sp.]|uniref:hypothetical protein n=1 Tax=Phenylobacterium sp. TaxID=1871053 RepID=UPI00272F0467|nr:hypothetical protein [Phenylobacterium sp.]MDP1873159.1 hypothetical protein [Phenylobacterium sp.]MDP3491304.1 hypothetical protein [Phenylobacterium sp.]